MPLKPGLLSFFLWRSACASAAMGPELFDHSAWERVLQSFVTEEGLVDYRALKLQPRDLRIYMQSLAATSPDNEPEKFPTEAHRLAYWINAYNASIVDRVVRSYPLGSIRELGGLLSSVFSKKQVIGGRELSHDDIEHRIIRKRFREPRIHFILNCASRSCAPLRRHALTADNLERMLQEAGESFLNDPRNLRIDPETGRVALSRYFDWFGDDFEKWLRDRPGTSRPTVLEYVKLFLSDEKRALLEQRKHWDIAFMDYDWSLNDAGRR